MTYEVTYQQTDHFAKDFVWRSPRVIQISARNYQTACRRALRYIRKQFKGQFKILSVFKQSNEVLIGYKGQELLGGVVYAPYIPLYKPLVVK